jgi:hypothetical protein
VKDLEIPTALSEALRHDATVVEINPDETPLMPRATFVLRGPAEGSVSMLSFSAAASRARARPVPNASTNCKSVGPEDLFNALDEFLYVKWLDDKTIHLGDL